MPDNGPMPTAPTVPADGASAAAGSRSRRWPVVTAVTVLMALYAGLGFRTHHTCRYLRWGS